MYSWPWDGAADANFHSQQLLNSVNFGDRSIRVSRSCINPPGSAPVMYVVYTSCDHLTHVYHYKL